MTHFSINSFLRLLWKTNRGHIIRSVDSDRFTILPSTVIDLYTQPDNRRGQTEAHQHALRQLNTLQITAIQVSSVQNTNDNSNHHNNQRAPGSHSPLNKHKLQYRSKNAAKSGWSLDDFKFRVVFIIWPALFGLSMAL